MTTPTGTISLNDVNVELGLSGTTTIQMNQANVRTLAGVGGSGTIISMNDLRGKSNRVAISSTFSSSTANASLNLSALGGYVAGKTDFTVTINGGVYLYATSTANAGLTLTGGTTGDTLTIVNNGFIMGQGGEGGNGTNTAGGALPTVGGTALSIPISATINNTNASAYIGGGGGGGGWAAFATYSAPLIMEGGGGGAGGGKGGNGARVGGSDLIIGPSGGAIGSSGSNGGTTNTVYSSGGSGGRIFPAINTSKTYTSTGSAGNSSFGLGGSGGGTGAFYMIAVGVTGTSTGGGGNNAGSASVTGTTNQSSAGGGGGGWGASGSSGATTMTGGGASAGAAGGKAVNLNGNSVTWVSGNTTRVYGAVS
jgi:hypothetical protein